MSKKRIIYVFLDEGGNFDFSIKGTRFFSLSCISTERPFDINAELDAYKYECIEWGLSQEYFHCTSDNIHVRKRVFGIILPHLENFKIDSLVVEKCKTGPALQRAEAFYLKMMGYLLRYVVNGYNKNAPDELIIITDSLPLNEKRKAIEKSVKLTLAEMLSNKTKYRILHHPSRAHYGLQLVDYCNWAILRKWERNDTEHYDLFKHRIRSEFDIFQQGKRKYY